MSRAVPSYRKHSNGQAFVQHVSIPTPDHRMYLGKWNSPESRRRYQRFLDKLAAARETPTTREHVREAHVDDLIQQYLAYARQYYRDENGPTKEYICMKQSLRHLGELHGSEIANQYGPRLLKDLQKHLIKKRYARGVINNRIGRVKRFFRWCSLEQKIRPDVYHGLLCVTSAQKGRDGVRETDGVKPVAREWVEATLPFVSPVIGAMIELQYFCGMRPEEVCCMRPCDIDMSGEIWLYRPREHKNSWRGHSLSKAIPLVAQRIIKPFLARPVEAYLFSPAESEEWRREHRPTSTSKPRKTKVYPSELRARARRKAERKPSSRLREHYDTDSYRRAIFYGFRRAAAAGVEISHWYPLQLRHSVATLVEKTLGRQAASRWLGHARLETTGIYVEVQIAELIAVAKAMDERWAG